jgi:hypothetical protein
VDFNKNPVTSTNQNKNSDTRPNKDKNAVFDDYLHYGFNQDGHSHSYSDAYSYALYNQHFTAHSNEYSDSGANEHVDIHSSNQYSPCSTRRYADSDCSISYFDPSNCHRHAYSDSNCYSHDTLSGSVMNGLINLRLLKQEMKNDQD